LALIDVEVHLQAGLGAGGIGGRGDHFDHPLQGIEGGDQAFDHFEAIFRTLEGVLRPPNDRQLPVVQELLQELAQAELDRLAVDEGQQDCAVIALERRAPLQVRQDLFRVGVPAQLDHDPHAFAVGFIADVGDAVDLSVVDLLSQLLDPAGFAQLIGQLRDHDRPALVAAFARLNLFDVGDAPHRDAAAAVEIGIPQAAAGEDLTAGGEVGTGHEFQELLVAELRLAHQGDQGIHHLPQVVGRNVGGHAHGDAGAAVQQQEGQLGREHGRLLLGAIEVVREIDRVAADFIEHRLVGDRCQTRFGVTHGRRWVVIHRAEVAMAIQQRIAAGEGLHQADQGVVDRLIAMGVVLAQHVADDAGAFAVGAIWGQPQLMHREQDAPLNRFEAIAGIGQGPSHDHAHGVFQVRALHLLMQLNRLDTTLVGWVGQRLFGARLGHPRSESAAQPTEVLPRAQHRHWPGLAPHRPSGWRSPAGRWWPGAGDCPRAALAGSC